MKINPANIQNTRQAKAHTEGQRIIDKVDSVVEAIDRFDQTESDFNKTDGSVLVDEVVIHEGNGMLDVRRWAEGATLVRDGEQLEFKANAQLAGTWGMIPVGLDTEITKIDSPEATTYKIKYEGSVAGPSTHVVEVDKATGEWDVQKKWMGIFPARLDS